MITPVVGLSTVVFLVTMGVVACLRSPETRHRAWFLSFVVTGLCLGLGWLRWEVPIPILPASKDRVEAETMGVMLSGPETGEQSQERMALSSKPSVPDISLISTDEPGFPETASPRKWRILPLIWGAGTCSALVPVLLGIWHWYRVRRRSQVVTDKRILGQYDAVCENLGLSARPRLIFSPDSATPLLASLLKPSVVLPEDAVGWSKSQCESALRHHELAHYQRQDMAVLLFSRTVVALLWFQPLAWVGLRRLRLEAEMAADDAVIAGQGEPETYAEILLNLCRRWEAWPVHTGLGMAPTSYLRSRLSRILDTGIDRTPLSRCKGNAIGGGVLGAALLLVLLKPVAANSAPAVLQKIAQQNQKAFAKVKSLSFVERDTILGEDAGRFQMEWWEMGAKCQYRYRQFDDVGDVDFGVSYSFDGMVARRMHFGGLSGGKTLYRKERPRDFDDWLIYRTFITTPLDFVTLVDTGSLKTVPPLLLINDVANWQRFLEDAQLLGQEVYQGRECVVVKVADRYLRNSSGGKERGDYVVYFDPARDYRPVGWRAYKADGKLFQELVVTQEETVQGTDGVEITLPREIKTFYSSITWIATFSDVSINSLGSFKFMLDETLAKHIYDQDSLKWSKAPQQPFLAITLADLDMTDLPMNELIGFISKRARESDPELGGFSICYTLPAGKALPKFSIKMNQPTVGEVFAEMQKQEKGLQVETSPKGLFLRIQ